jgi:hypothetical protein
MIEDQMASTQGPSNKRPVAKAPPKKPVAKPVVKNATAPSQKPAVQNAAKPQSKSPPVKTLPIKDLPAATNAKTTPSGTETQGRLQVQAAKVQTETVRAKNIPAETVPSSAKSNDIPAVLQSRMETLENNVRSLQPAVENYSQRFGQIAGTNYTQLEQMGKGFAVQNDVKAGQGNPFSEMGRVSSDRLNPEQQKLLQASSTELTRQLRQDLRAGRLPALINPDQLSQIQTPQEAVAQMRFNQGLQANGIPQDFNGASPQNREQLNTQIAVGGMMPSLQNAPETLSQYRQALSEQTAINQEREKLGLPPISLPELSAMQTRLNSLDTQITAFGRQQVQQFGGTTSTQLMPFQPGDPVEVVNGNSRQMEDLHRQGLAEQLQNRDPSKRFSSEEVATIQARFDLANNGLNASLREPLTPTLQDEMIRVNDSINLLAGNRSGLTIQDVPMSPELRRSLGLNLNDAPPPSFSTLLSRDAQIDRIALLPENQRLEAIKRAAIGIGVDASEATETTQKIGKRFDSLILPKISNKFFGNDDINEIHTKLAKTRQEGSEEMGKLAVVASANGSHRLALDTLRTARGYESDQVQSNQGFERFTRETQLQGLLMVQDTALGLVSTVGPGMARSFGQGAFRQTVTQPLRQELQGIPREALRELAEQEATSMARQQLNQVTSSDLKAMTQQHYRNLLGQQIQLESQQVSSAASRSIPSTAPGTSSVDAGDWVVFRDEKGQMQMVREGQSPPKPSPALTETVTLDSTQTVSGSAKTSSPSNFDTPTSISTNPAGTGEAATSPAKPFLSDLPPAKPLPPGTDMGDMVMMRGKDGKPVIFLEGHPGQPFELPKPKTTSVAPTTPPTTPPSLPSSGSSSGTGAASLPDSNLPNLPGTNPPLENPSIKNQSPGFYFQSHQSWSEQIKSWFGIKPPGTPIGSMMSRQEVNGLNQMLRPMDPNFAGNNNQLFKMKLPGNSEETLLRIPKDFASDLTGGQARILGAERIPITYPKEMQPFLRNGSFPDEMILARGRHGTEAITSHPIMPNANPVFQSGSPLTTAENIAQLGRMSDGQVQDFIRMNMGIERMGVTGELNLQNMSVGPNGLGRFDINIVEDQLLQNGGRFAFSQGNAEQSVARVYDQILDTIQTGRSQLNQIDRPLQETMRQAGINRIIIQADGAYLIPSGFTSDSLMRNAQTGLSQFEEAIRRQMANPEFQQELLRFGHF